MLHDIKHQLRELLAESKAVLVNGSDQTDGGYLGKRTPTGGTYVTVSTVLYDYSCLPIREMHDDTAYP